MDVGREQPPCFTGRQDTLQRIHSFLWPPPPSSLSKSQPHHSGRKKITISGISGAGKTAVALEYAYTHQEQYYVVFWLNARNADELAISASQTLGCIIEEFKNRWGKSWLQQPELCQRLALELRVRDGFVDMDSLVKEATKKEQSVERLMAWLPKRMPWLLILDGYDDPMAFDIDRLLPKTGIGHVLITSQHQDSYPLAEQIALPSKLEEGEGVELLKSVAGLQAASCCSGSCGT